MVAHMHNQRILRFLLILSAVVLTIFVYASYSTTSPAYSPPTHLRNTPSAAEALKGGNSHQNHTAVGEIIGGNEFNEVKAGIGVRAISSDPNESKFVEKSRNVANNRKSNPSGSKEGAILSRKQHTQAQVQVQQQKHHREPTIDVDAMTDSVGGNENDINSASDDIPDDVALNNELLEEQYVQNVDNTQGNVNSTNPAVAQPHKLGPKQKEQQNSAKDLSNQLVNTTNNNSNNNNNNNNGNINLNKILDSDVLIPTSNLQKFIENADKILKNITQISSGPNDLPDSPAVAGANEPQESVKKVEEVKQEKNTVPEVDIIPRIDTGNNIENILENNNLDNSIEGNDEALPPSVVMTIKRAGLSSNVNNNKAEPTNVKEAKPIAKVVIEKAIKEAKPITPKTVGVSTPRLAYDTAKGIQTNEIYEAGHLNDEINIDKVCPRQGIDLKLFVLITSAPSHMEARLAIRQTWGHYGTRRDVSIAFMLGRTLNETMNKALTEENFMYGDLVRGNFIDSYNNLTLKTVSSLEWVHTHCNKAKYLLKTDDDMFINVPKLLAFLNSHSKEKHVIFGRLAKKWKPIRNKKSKYYVSTDQFAAPIFPPFTTGPAYVLSMDTVNELYVRSLNQVYLKLEDVFTTGIVAQQLGIKRVHVNEFLNRRIAFNPCNIRKTISVHMIKANEQFDLWKKLLDQTTKCK